MKLYALLVALLIFTTTFTVCYASHYNINPTSINATYQGNPDRQLTTTVQDPQHPKEPWVVTTYGLQDESEICLIRRHKAMVDAVRDALNS